MIRLYFAKGTGLSLITKKDVEVLMGDISSYKKHLGLKNPNQVFLDINQLIHLLLDFT